MILLKEQKELERELRQDALKPVFERLYGAAAGAQQERYLGALSAFSHLFGQERRVALFSTPGRTEVGGNHTDHQHGRVLAAGVNLDVIAAASPREDQRIIIKSEGFVADCVQANDLAHYEEEYGHSAALIRGICAGFTQRGYRVGGLDAYTTSNVLKGSGLSSSAAFEVLVATMLNHFYNEGKIDAVEIAKIAQYAEREYFGKPCGLMDQTACSVGGLVQIDFENPEKPLVRKVDFSFSSCGHDLVIVDTKGDHADLTSDYAAIGEEMCAVARFFGKEVLREVSEENFYASLAEIRERLGERAVLRAMHFFDDNTLALREAEALEKGDFEAFKRFILRSGISSYEHLQNVYSTHEPQAQGIPLCLALTQKWLGGRGAWRVHGGGFAGTVQVFVPCELTSDYCEKMERVFGEGACHVLTIRPEGAVRIA